MRASSARRCTAFRGAASSSRKRPRYSSSRAAAMQGPRHLPNSCRMHPGVRDGNGSRSGRRWPTDGAAGRCEDPDAKIDEPALENDSLEHVLSWRVSTTLDSVFCIEAVEEAIARYGRPTIFNTDQGAQFTSAAFTGLLLDHGIRLSMDGRGCWRDNIFVERLWRSIKYEEVSLHAYDSVAEAKVGIGRSLARSNTRGPHSSLADRTPDEANFTLRPPAVAA